MQVSVHTVPRGPCSAARCSPTVARLLAGRHLLQFLEPLFQKTAGRQHGRFLSTIFPPIQESMIYEGQNLMLQSFVEGKHVNATMHFFAQLQI